MSAMSECPDHGLSQTCVLPGKCAGINFWRTQHCQHLKQFTATVVFLSWSNQPMATVQWCQEHNLVLGVALKPPAFVNSRLFDALGNFPDIIQVTGT
jgi:hypothetical protein